MSLSMRFLSAAVIAWYSTLALGVDQKPLTAEELLKGARVPVRREYPLSKTVNPCDDFYQYTCGSVIKGFKLPEDRSSHTFSLNDSAERLLQAKKTFLKELPKRKDLSKRAGELRDVYQSCMDSDANKVEEKELVEREAKLVNGVADSKSLYELMASRIDQADYTMFGYGTIPNQDAPDFEDVIIMSKIMSLPERSYYSDKAVVKDLADLIASFFKTIGLSDPDKRAAAVVEVEKSFAQVHPLPAEMRERVSSRNSISREDLVKTYPNLQLAKFLERVPGKIKFRNLTPESLEFTNNMMSKVPLSTLKDLVLFHSLSDEMDDAYPAFYAKGFAFRKKHLGGPDKRPDRDERCTRMVMHTFERELDAELLPILFPNFPEKEFRQLVEKVRGSLILGLEQNTWLSKEGKAAAIKKMKTAKLMVVKPLNDDEWDFNPEADYDPKKPVTNIKILEKNKIEKEISELPKGRIRNRWLMGPLTVNAYYMPMDNTFVLPIGILQYPLYDPSLPESVNIGAIGTIIGHELGHGIDDKGARYDDEGRLRMWMTEKDQAEFKKRSTRLVDQFNKIGHNGELTLGENIGDHVGLTTAYKAAFPDDGKESKETVQAFFVQHGRTWCQVIRPKMKDMILKTDPHALGDARVNQQVRHLPAFQSAFSCNEKNKLYMNAADQLRIW